MTYQELTAKSFALRKDVADLIYHGKGGHIGGDFSVMDILVTLYYLHINITPDAFNSPARDHFIMSKGHSVEALYAVLCDRGFFSKDEMASYLRFGSVFIGHPNNKIKGIEINSGSLGHGLSAGVGMAIAGKMDGRHYYVYVVMGDGELAEGSVWEGAMAAGHYKLDNIIAVIDRNGLQISGPTEQVMAQGNIGARWASFGWTVFECDGHSIASLDAAVQKAKKSSGRPSVIIASTIKGYGYSEAENKAEWHHKVPSTEQYNAIIKELETRQKKAMQVV
jgi:transketolase